MIIKISEDLKEQEIWANGSELFRIMGKDFMDGKRINFYSDDEKVHAHTFSHPVLMTDNYRIGKLEPPVRDSLFSLFACKPRWVEYDGVSTYWDEAHKSVWCPSIDTILFAKVLRNYLKENDFKHGLEIGCGSGFLTKYCLEKGKYFEDFLAIDINPDAIKSCRDNIEDSRLLTEEGDALEKIKGRKFDLIICNPPYIPRPGSIDDNAYEGVALMRHLVQEGQKYLNKGGRLLINISSLGWNLAFDKEPIMKYEVLDKMKVPLKVNNILNNQEWVDYLIKQGMEKDYHEGYEYWQELNILEFLL